MSMTTASSPSTSSPTSPLGSALRGVYFTRFGFTVVWAALLFLTAGAVSPLLTVLLIVYPLFDAVAVFWQIRAERDTRRTKVSEWVNIAVSLLVAIGLGVASTISSASVLIIWGVWAIGAGIPQLITAIRNRRSGGQVAQMLSGGLSVFAGAAFLFQGIQGNGSVTGVAGYALLGAVFFLISAIRLSTLIRKAATA